MSMVPPLDGYIALCPIKVQGHPEETALHLVSYCPSCCIGSRIGSENCTSFTAVYDVWHLLA
jgi:hypothetical protein